MTDSFCCARGVGVVGEQPVIFPRTGFEYSSACPLSTPNGRMVTLQFFRSAQIFNNNFLFYFSIAFFLYERNALRCDVIRVVFHLKWIFFKAFQPQDLPWHICTLPLVLTLTPFWTVGRRFWDEAHWQGWIVNVQCRNRTVLSINSWGRQWPSPLNVIGHDTEI